MDGIKMKDTTKIRHTNARKILVEECLNSMKVFADKIGRSEQQCSNLLREKTNVRIGDKLARLIERSFGYPEGWLDTDTEGVDDMLTLEGIKLVNMFNNLSDCVDELKTFSIEHHSFYNHSRFCQKLNKNISALLKINRHAKSDFMDAVAEKLEVLLLQLGHEVTYDSRIGGFMSEDALFILSDPLDRRSVHTRYLNTLRVSERYKDGHKVYEVIPFFCVDRAIRFLIEEGSLFSRGAKDRDPEELEVIEMINNGENVNIKTLSDELRLKINNIPKSKIKK
jgi:hypothetical protein